MDNIFNEAYDIHKPERRCCIEAWEALKYAALGLPDHLADKKILSAEILMTLPDQDTVNVHMAMGVLCALTPERICRAILKAYGIEVES